jgi:hypothetical protein
MSRYTIPVLVVSMKNRCHTLCAEGAKHVHLWAVTNMWIFAAHDPAAVGIDLTTLITEN